ncbi:MAG TPA: Hsp70 family protein [Streptosporangiaceae bacterium]|nr:Hsp70 family protein [Streptosporangiaceae bacterium]
MDDICIGVDLGTCYSSVGYNDRHVIHFIQDPAAPQLTYSIPSCVLLREDNNRFVFGELAESEKNATPEGYKSEFKRDLGEKIPYRLRNRKISAAELTAEFLAFLVTLTKATLDVAPASAVITVPASYDEFRRSLIDEAARRAGLPAVSLVEEPVAAVISAAERGQVTGDATILVYDLGGGTFDAAVVRLDGGQQTVLGAYGLGNFGGTDIDRLIEQDFARKVGDEFAELLAGQDTDDPKLLARARRARIAAEDFCRTIKHRLSSADHVSDFLNLRFYYELSRQELEDMVRPQLDRTVSTCRQLLNRVALAPDQIDTVLLVGGTSRMPMVRDLLDKELARPVRRAPEPELAVCMGAAILAGAGEQTKRWKPDVAGPGEAELRRREERARSAGAGGNPGGARDQLAALLPVRERVSGAADPGTLTLRRELARWTGEAGDAAGARDQLAELLPVVKEALGGQHPDTLAVQRQLGHWKGNWSRGD